jgi:hypothetical protein
VSHIIPSSLLSLCLNRQYSWSVSEFHISTSFSLPGSLTLWLDCDSEAIGSLTIRSERYEVRATDILDIPTYSDLTWLDLNSFTLTSPSLSGYAGYHYYGYLCITTGCVNHYMRELCASLRPVMFPLFDIHCLTDCSVIWCFLTMWFLVVWYLFVCFGRVFFIADESFSDTLRSIGYCGGLSRW